jgi:hypothetical protein
MKVYFCRDSDGTPTTWRYKQTKPRWFLRVWDLMMGHKKAMITEGCEGTFRKFGKGYHGVRKGQMKLLDLKPKVRGTFVNTTSYK